MPPSLAAEPPATATPPTSHSPIARLLDDIHARFRSNFAGALPTYIPQLAGLDPALFGIALATPDGQIYTAGDASHAFTIQSISKPFVYGMALEDHGPEYVMSKVGVEPTGEAFNSIVLDEVHNRPYNPMVNAGAIATTAMLKGDGFEARLSRVLDRFGRYAGRPLDIDAAVWRSEQETGHRNRAIAFLELNSGMIDEPVAQHLDLYFAQCSMLVTARDLAVIGATLANGGVNPITNQQALARCHVKRVLGVMATCGMYDYSGEWMYRVGLPAKSGVGGGIVAVLPGQFGLGVFSPLLDRHGNSCRGIQVCEELSDHFNLHLFDAMTSAVSAVRRSYSGSVVSSKRERPAWQRAFLADQDGRAIAVFELQGDLFFASMEQVARRLTMGDEPPAAFVVLDGRQVSRADATALALLSSLQCGAARAGRQLILAGFPVEISATVSRLSGLDAPAAAVNIFHDLDTALEWCEDRALSAATPVAVAAENDVPIERMELLASLTPDELAHVAAIVERAEFCPGETIVHQGELADRLFLLAAGSASVYVRRGAGDRSPRLAAFAPGVAFGELAMLNGGRRTADVVADTRVVCHVLALDRLAQLAAQHPDIQRKLLIAVGQSLVYRLHRAHGELGALDSTGDRSV